ncbi:hypothetical protein SAMN05444002_0582 [Vannielia litorea]|uniref:Uncharacterized protein n=1 Tax=Vannielia litorea TaxID=1217970 RepID=A0A1N6ECE5_9RHOB|nr:hypothetical protein SAMN05444002_0582 [Vannielia litorea]
MSRAEDSVQAALGPALLERFDGMAHQAQLPAITVDGLRVELSISGLGRAPEAADPEAADPESSVALLRRLVEEARPFVAVLDKAVPSARSDLARHGWPEGLARGAGDVAAHLPLFHRGRADSAAGHRRPDLRLSRFGRWRGGGGSPLPRCRLRGRQPSGPARPARALSTPPPPFRAGRPRGSGRSASVPHRLAPRAAVALPPPAEIPPSTPPSSIPSSCSSSAPAGCCRVCAPRWPCCARIGRRTG